jgi:hypothetical protein
MGRPARTAERGTGRGEELRRRARRLWHRLFPPQLELPADARRRLAALFPTLDLRRVSFHRGLPHLLSRGTEGMVLPAPLSPVRCRIYVQPDCWQPETDDGFSLLVHEAFHALQMQETGPGLGLVRPFLILYLACAAGNGFRYVGHPMEEDAYEVAGRWLSRFEKAVADGTVPAPVPASGVSFWRKLAASTPGGAPLSPLWLLAWTAAAAVLWAGSLLVVGAGSLAAGVIWLSGTFLFLLKRIFPKFSE